MFSKIAETGIRVPLSTQTPLTLLGTLSTTGISTLLPLALMFRQSSKNVLGWSPLGRVGQVIRKTLLEKLDDIPTRCFALDLTCEVRPQFVD
jgi:hypothetical protein